MKKLILGAASALAISSSAFGADIYRGEVSYKDAPIAVAPHIWSGFYIGANAGYGWDASDERIFYLDRGDRNDGFADFSAAGPDLEGGFGGVQIGYNFMAAPRLVFGVEADIQGGDIKDKYVTPLLEVNGTPTPFLDPQNIESSIDWFGTIRGRIGYAFDKTLVYATGGFAFGGVEYRISNNAGLGFKEDDTQTGFVAGGGIEHKFTPNWSLKVEYQYIDLGDKSIKGLAANPNSIDYTARDLETEFHTVRVGVNYHLGSRHEALK